METQITTVTQAFPADKQYAIPSYQRNYVWTEEGQWEPLWEDVRALTEHLLSEGPQDAQPHFLGTIITKQIGIRGFINRWWVVDGQQRLTTLQLLVAAARSAFIQYDLRPYASMLSGVLANDPNYVIIPGDRYKIEHKSSDYAGFRSIVDDALSSRTPDVAPVSPLGTCYTYFLKTACAWLKSLGDLDRGAHAHAFNQGILQKLVVVDIRLDAGQNSHAIFEALNARGEPLAEWEKTKNYVLSLAVREDDPDGDQTYKDHLERYDADMYWNATVKVPRFTGKRIDLFLFYFAQLELPGRRQQLSGGSDIRPLRRSRLYREFRYVGEHLYRHDHAKLEAMLERLGRYADIYRQIDERQNFSDYAQEVMRRRKVLNLASLVPVFMELVAKLGCGDELDDALRVVDSYLMRRVALKARYSGFDDIAFGHVQALRDAHANEICSVLVERFQKSTGANRWPTNSEVTRHLLSANMYWGIATPRLQLLLGGIAGGMHKERGILLSVPFPLNPLTVEHVAPQNWKRHWQEDLGFQDSDEDRHRLYQLVHCIGNLTLVTLPMNSKLGDGPWSYKAELLSKDNLELNRRLLCDMEGSIWNEPEINRRSKQLADYVNKIWPHADVLRHELAIAPPEGTSRRMDSIQA